MYIPRVNILKSIVLPMTDVATPCLLLLMVVSETLYDTTGSFVRQHYSPHSASSRPDAKKQVQLPTSDVRPHPSVRLERVSYRAFFNVW